MKIRVTETTIEADARELRESGTLADNFARMLARCFQSHEPFEDEEDIVRCKDCVYCQSSTGMFYCAEHEKTVSADGYCSCGERKTDE